MSTVAGTTHYVVAVLTNFEAESRWPVEAKLPAGCIGTFLVFADYTAALEWAGGNRAAVHPFHYVRHPREANP